MESWWDRPSPNTETDDSFLIVELKLHDLPRWKNRVLERLSALVSNAMQELLQNVRAGLVVTNDTADETKLATADLVFEVEAERAERIRALLAQVKVNEKTGERLTFSNAYRFISCESTENGRFRVTARLALGVWRERVVKGTTKRTHSLSLIPATTGFQQLLGTYLPCRALRILPRALQGGVCQEVAQQVTSYLGQLNSSKVKGEVVFPTVEDRDPERRRRAYEAAVDSLALDVRPFNYAKLRDKFPGEYAADDPRGDRLIVDDERWFAVTRTSDPHPIPLRFVQGGSVTLLEGTARFNAGVSKKNRHRRNAERSERVEVARPERVRHKGETYLRQWYAALPLLDAVDEAVREAAGERRPRSGRGLELGLTPLPIAGQERWRARENEMLVLLSGNRDRAERILRRRDLKIAWSLLVCRESEWYLQLTLRVPQAVRIVQGRCLGVSFGIDAVASWVLLDEQGHELERGALAPNEQILAFLSAKAGLEWDQQKGRWIGGKTFGERLESIAHGVANTLVDIAAHRGTRLAIEDVSYVQKTGPDHSQNVLFTAWNFGQLRRFIGYKAPLAGLGECLTCSDYLTGLTCPSCGAMRGAKVKPEKAKTWRENGTLHCRVCGFSGVISPHDKARRVALHALGILAERKKREAAKQTQASPP